MTTESMQVPATRGAGVLLKAGAASAALVVALAVVALLVDGDAATRGALCGGAVAVVVFVSGSLVVNAVAGLAPGLSLVFALSTYLLQVFALALFFTVLTGSGLLDGTLDRAWLGASIIGVTLVWLGVQVALARTARIPVYDLPTRAGER